MVFDRKKFPAKQQNSPTLQSKWNTLIFQKVVTLTMTTCVSVPRPTQLRRESLCSAATDRLVVSPVKLTTAAHRAFPSVGPHTWNDLPDDVTSTESLSTFRQQLKTNLFTTKSFSCLFPGSGLQLTFSPVNLAAVLLYLYHVKNYWSTETDHDRVNVPSNFFTEWAEQMNDSVTHFNNESDELRSVY